jgi:hypothetical protein
MRKTDIYISSLRISRAIQESGVDKLLEAFLNPSAKVPQPTEIMEVFQKYTLASRDFGENEAKILETFKLKSLSDPEFWANVISKGSEKRKEMIGSVANNWHLYSEMLPRFIDLITLEGDVFAHLEDTADAQESGYVSVVILEAPGAASTPERISDLMMAMHTLHDALIQLHEMKDSDLHVVFCDSGSSKEFIFGTSKELAKLLRDLLRNAVDYFLYHKERKIEKRIAIVAKSLPILDTIETRRDKLGPEKVKILENVVIQGISKFLEAGAVLRDFEGDDRAKALMPPRRKLLTHRKPLGPTASTE